MTSQSRSPRPNSAPARAQAAAQLDPKMRWMTAERARRPDRARRAMWPSPSDAGEQADAPRARSSSAENTSASLAIKNRIERKQLTAARYRSRGKKPQCSQSSSMHRGAVRLAVPSPWPTCQSSTSAGASADLLDDHLPNLPGVNHARCWHVTQCRQSDRSSSEPRVGNVDRRLDTMAAARQRRGRACKSLT